MDRELEKNEIEIFYNSGEKIAVTQLRTHWIDLRPNQRVLKRELKNWEIYIQKHSEIFRDIFRNISPNHHGQKKNTTEVKGRGTDHRV